MQAQPDGFRHWRIEPNDADIIRLHIDTANAKANVLSREVLAEFGRVLTVLEQRSPRGVIIVSDKPAGFIAGADVREFKGLQDPEEALALIRSGQELFNRLEALPCPTVCMIHGYCLGGGLELALACRYRVAEDAPHTRLGLPEVRLGIHPGFGGTLRLPCLIGAPAALELMLSGRSVDARTAKRLGLVDHALPKRQLDRAAQALIAKAPAPRRPGLWARLVSYGPVRPLMAYELRRRVAERAPAAHYPAPYALIDLWQKHWGDHRAMLDHEAHSVAQLLVGPTAQNLVRVFSLQERLKSLAAKDASEVRHVHVIGAGSMGGDIAAWCALQGLRVSLQDRAPAYIGPAVKRAHALFQKHLKDTRLVQGAMDRLLPDIHGAGLKRADVVIEAIYEDPETKHRLYREIEPRMRQDAWLATNTSSIPLETLAEALARPERLVGLHFFNPVAKMPLVEVVQGAASDARLVAQALAFVRRIDRLPLPVRSSPAFLVNRILMPYLLEAMVLETEGIPPHAVDRAATEFGMPMGPLLLADTVGLDVCLSVAQVLAQHKGVTIPERLQRLVQEGRLGRKSGQGFYRFSNGAPAIPKRSGGTVPMLKELQERLLSGLLNEAVACLREGVVADADLVDAGMLFGAGFPPFRGGPIHYIRQIDTGDLAQRLSELERRHGTHLATGTG